MRPSNIIINAFKDLCLRYGLVVDALADDPVIGTYVVFKGARSSLTVDFENGGYSAWFDLYEAGKPTRKLGINTILRSVGAERAISFEAQDMNALGEQLRRLAELCEKYAAPAVRGDPSFYNEFNAI